MKAHLKIVLIFLITGFSLNSACKKGNVTDEKAEEIVSPGINDPEKALLPVQIGTGKNKLLFTYDENQLLTRIEYGDGSSKVMQYTKNKIPLRLFTYQGTLMLRFTDFLTDESNTRIVTAYYNQIEKQKYMITGSYVLSYGSSMYPSGISYYNENERLIAVQQKNFTATGNLLAESSDDQSRNSNNQYDENQGIFKNVKYNWLFALEEENKLFLCANNNIKQFGSLAKPDRNQNFSYTYSQNQYPSTVNYPLNGETISAKITYKMLE